VIHAAGIFRAGIQHVLNPSSEVCSRVHLELGIAHLTAASEANLAYDCVVRTLCGLVPAGQSFKVVTYDKVVTLLSTLPLSVLSC
jgi:hypothetical protein